MQLWGKKSMSYCMQIFLNYCSIGRIYMSILRKTGNIQIMQLKISLEELIEVVVWEKLEK